MYKKAIASIIVLLTLGLLFVSIPQAKANPQFVIASWDYPDQYGQGISGLFISENSTGDWLGVTTIDYDEAIITLDWNVSVFIRISCFSHFNNSLVGALDLADGQNFHRHNVTVTNLGETVFSQQNFTYTSGFDYDDPIWDWSYSVILNFLPQVGEIYIVTVTYEVYW